MAQVEDFYLPDDLYYERKDHLWARVEGDLVRVGLNSFGQRAAGNVTYLKLMPVGKAVAKGRAFGSIEAGKYIGPLRAPVGGRIVAMNDAVLDRPALVASDPYGEGWFIVLDPADLAADLGNLVHGLEVQPWLEGEVGEYRQKGILKS